jgi:hypothetical protein
MSWKNNINKIRDFFRENQADEPSQPASPIQNTQNQQEEQLIPIEEQVMEPPRDYQQWYDEDRERWELEVNAMKDRGFEAGILPDGRVCFVPTKESESREAYDVALICDWLYPQKPPSVFVEGEPEELNLPRNADGSIDLLSASMTWEPSMAAVTMLDYLEEKLEPLRATSNRDDACVANYAWQSEEECFDNHEGKPGDEFTYET